MESRQNFIFSASAASLSCLSALASVGRARAAEKRKPSKQEISANEDLMREHGVLRRALLVYSLTAPKLKSHPSAAMPVALNQTAVLFRKFGEDYHERALEEKFIFPQVKRADSQVAAMVDVLLMQHQRGRQITDYIMSVTRSGSRPSLSSAELGRALDAFVLMYQEHTAREDIVIFPAWHSSLAQHEMGERFEDIEHKQFGHDGFEDAVAQISAIEQTLGLGDLSRFTAPPPPQAF